MGAVCFAAVVVPIISTADPFAQDLGKRLLPPFWADGSQPAYPLGTDTFGRDVWIRLTFGARYTLLIAGVALVLSATLGVLLGIVSGYSSGPFSALIMRWVDAQLSLPPVLLAILVAAVFGESVVALILVLAATSWPVFSRVLFGVSRGLRRSEFVTAAISVGASDGRILVRHVLPNVVTPVIVLSTIQVGRIILITTGLSFLGVGIPDPLPDWGNMLADGQRAIFTTPWLVTIPGLAITATVLGVNLLGDGLRWSLDPRANQNSAT